MSEDRTKKIIEGVPKPGYGKYSCPFPGCVASVMEYIGEAGDYGSYMALSGAAFRRAWQQGDGGNVDLMYFSPLPEKYLFEALGWKYKTINRGDESRMREAIIRSIDGDLPVFAFGIIGPPECGIVAGYENGGHTLVGYSFFQGHNIEGYYHRSDWYKEDLHMIIVLEERVQESAEEQALKKTLDLALAMGRDQLLAPHHVTGLAANLAYADAVEDGNFFPIDDDEKMGLQAMLFWDQSAMLYERKYAAHYLRKMAARFPRVSEILISAAEQYELICAETGWIPQLGGQLAMQKITPRDSPLGNADGRRKIADAYRSVNKIEEQALDYIRRAREALG